MIVVVLQLDGRSESVISIDELMHFPRSTFSSCTGHSAAQSSSLHRAFLRHPGTKRKYQLTASSFLTAKPGESPSAQRQLAARSGDITANIIVGLMQP